MATTFEGFGGDFTSRRNVFSGKPGSAESFLQGIPPELLKILNKLAESGVFGEGGVEALLQSVNQQAGFQRAQLGRGLRGTLGRRLGPRSGGIDNLIANRVFAPSFAGAAQTRGNLLAENQRSKLGGLSGIQDLLGFFQNQFALEEQTQGPGFLDFVDPAIDIGAIAAAPFTGGATLAIPAARRAGQQNTQSNVRFGGPG